MSTYPVIPLLNEFRKAIDALSKSNGLLNTEKEKLRAWKEIEATIKKHSNEFEKLKEYEDLVNLIKNNEFKKVETWTLKNKKQ